MTRVPSGFLCLKNAPKDGRFQIWKQEEAELRLCNQVFSFQTLEEDRMKKYLFAAAIACAVAAPAMADEVGVRAGPVGAGVTVGESHDRDRDRDRTVIREHEPESKTVIKKEDGMGNREKTVIHHDH
jgi:hypothetical protein